MPVILVNKSRRMKVYNLDTQEMIALRGKKQTFQQLVLAKDGSRKPARVQKMIAGSLTLCAGEKTGKFSDGTPLPEGILQVPAIAADISKGVLRASVVKEQPAAAKKKSTTNRRGRK